MHTALPQNPVRPVIRPSETRSASLSAAARRRAEEGLHPTNLPLGYRCDTGTVAVPDPAVAPLVKEAIGLYATGKYSLRKLLDVMVEKGLRSKRGRRPSLSAFHKMLGNPFYAGYIRLDGSVLKGKHEMILDLTMLKERGMNLSVNVMSS